MQKKERLDLGAAGFFGNYQDLTSDGISRALSKVATEPSGKRMVVSAGERSILTSGANQYVLSIRSPSANDNPGVLTVVIPSFSFTDANDSTERRTVWLSTEITSTGLWKLDSSAFLSSCAGSTILRYTAIYSYQSRPYRNWISAFPSWLILISRDSDVMAVEGRAITVRHTMAAMRHEIIFIRNSPPVVCVYLKRPDKCFLPLSAPRCDIIFTCHFYTQCISMMKKHLAISSLAAWVVLVIGFMVLARTLDLEIFFVLWLIGILIIVELASDHMATPRYLGVLKLVIASGVILFGVIVARKIMEILSQ